MASEGLRQLVVNTSTKSLESELKTKSDNIRTIIKARGMTYPDTTGKTFAVFRVDSSHHLISLVALVFPSPDWVVGVSQLELCQTDCTWLASKTVNLYPWDIGIDEGITYTSVKQPSTPPQPIHKLVPNSPDSPFYHLNSKEMKPLARLQLIRQRLYEKTCNNTSMATTLIPKETVANVMMCAMEPWSPWTMCSATCGLGFKYRFRKLKSPNDHKHCENHVQLMQRASCIAYKKLCHYPGTKKKYYGNESFCDLGAWSEWSSCSATCGRGTKTRSRRYKSRLAAKICSAAQTNPPILEENLPCNTEGGASACKFEYSKVASEENCQKLIYWSQWSPCSVMCGTGFKVRFSIDMLNGKTPRTLIDSSNISDKENNYYEIAESRLKNQRCNSKMKEETVLCYENPCSMIQNKNHTEKIIQIHNASIKTSNCKVSKWSPWSRCYFDNGTFCGIGYQLKTRNIVQNSVQNAINSIDSVKQLLCTKVLTKKRTCHLECSEVEPMILDGIKINTNVEEGGKNCRMSNWTAWSGCRESCKLKNSIEERHRVILHDLTGVDKRKNCPPTVEKRACDCL